MDRAPRLKVAPESVKRLKEEPQLLFRRVRGRRLDRVIAELNLVIREWVAYFRMSDVRLSFEKLDEWLRRKLRLPAMAAVETALDPAGEAHRAGL
jgi:RNA-directed DNA polymerase